MLSKAKNALADDIYLVFYVALIIISLALVLVKLGSLTSGLSAGELHLSHFPVGFRGIYRNSFYLPYKLIQSVVFKAYVHHGRFLTRLPSAMFGFMSCLMFGYLIYLWHGRRTSVLASILFIFAAFTLHVSRLASYDIVYYFSMVLLLLNHTFFYRYYDNKYAYLLNWFCWGLLLTIPGLIYLVFIDIILQKELLLEGWQELETKKTKLASLFVFLIWLPLLVHNLLKLSSVKYYLGLPAKFPSGLHLIKQFAAVPVHLFIRGPLIPSLWLGKTPVLDFLSLALSLLGIAFYLKNLKSSRSRLILTLFILCILLIGLGGAVSFALIVPLAYACVATGIAYLLHEWLTVFPQNPVARNIGIYLLAFAILFAAFYNYRSYFVAWRYNSSTKQTFSVRA